MMIMMQVLISDWAHCFQCLIIENRTYRHLPYIISECDGRGISSNGKELNQERTLWEKGGVMSMEAAQAYTRTAMEAIKTKALEEKYADYKAENEKFLADNKAKVM